MDQIHISYHKTKIGEFILGSYENKLCILDYRYRKMRTRLDNRIKKGLKAQYLEKEDELIAKTKKQLDEYLQGERKKFDIPLLIVGSDFQKQVWEELLKVPYGQTISYLDLAKKIDNPKAVRAVANANGANAIAIIIPCHRVIESNGGLGGYAGGLGAKKKLLNIENSLFTQEN